MVKFVTPDNSTMTSSLRHTEQYDNCSGLLIESDATPLEELDPAILSCGLPAIVLGVGETLNLSSADVPTIIRYTVAQLLALRKAPFSHRRPAAIDDPCTGGYPIWQRNGFRRAGGSDEELYGGSAAGRKPNDRHRDNGLVPRFRRNHEFSNRNHHVIVKSYSGGDGGISAHQMRLQDTIIEEEPEWVVAGPTSRLDTIELRGFDDDIMRNMTDSLKATSYPVVAGGGGGGGGSGTQSHAAHGKRSDFYDELLHYEHVHQKQPGGGKHDTSGSGGDGESVSTSNNGNSPPPARSTPTKHVTDQNNNNNHGKSGGAVAGGRGGSSSSGSGYSTDVNVSNFEEIMKFDSILGDSSDTESSSFNKFLRRSNSFTGSGSGGQQHHLNQQQYHHHYHQHQHSHHHQGSHHQQHHVRFALDRNTNHYQRPAGSGRLSMSSLQHPPLGLDVGSDSYDSQAPPPVGGHRSAGNEPVGTKPFQRLVEMMAAQSQRVQHQQQQQYLMQLLQNNQQTESLRQMLMKNASLDGRQQGRQQQQQQQQHQHQGQHQGQRVPTQRELQLHTQSIMKNALLRKKIVEQGRIILEQQQQGPQEPIPAVQQLIQSIYPNVQRSLAVLASNNSANQQQQQQQQHSGFSGEMRNEAASFSAGSSGGRRSLVRSSSAPSNRRPPF